MLARSIRVLAVVACWLVACDGVAPTLGDGQQGGGSNGTTAPASSSTPCQGFRDISDLCSSLACLEEAPCDPGAPVPCGPGLNGDGVCFAGLCAFRNAAQGCASAADCPCGLCGSDGRCYEDRGGQCGRCQGGSASPDLACKSCLASCQGTGPLCCSGAGCLCEGQCGGFMLSASWSGSSHRPRRARACVIVWKNHTWPRPLPGYARWQAPRTR